MKDIAHNIKNIIAGTLFSFCIALPVIAEDIEIYTQLGASAPTAQPNIMFILDSSGSMDTETTLVKPAYDASIVYSGCYNLGKVYYSTSGGPPSCTSINYFNEGLNMCHHSLDQHDDSDLPTGVPGPLAANGFYQGYIAQFVTTTKVWRKLSTLKNTERIKYPIECKQDSGNHGTITAPTPDVYIADGGAGWTSTVPADTNNPHPVWAGGSNNYTLFHYNYLNYLVDTSLTTTGVSRFDQTKTAIKDVVANNSNVNIGLMRFDSASPYEGGAVMYPVLDVNATRQDFYSRVDTANAGGGTPLAETYFEALRYFGGGAVHYGDLAVPSNQTGTKDNGNPLFYQTPIEVGCQKNYIIYLSDGSPTSDTISDTLKATMPGFSSSCDSSDAANSCLDEMAGWAATNDIGLRTDLSQLAGKQTVTTYTIGFDFSGATADLIAAEQLLRDTAAAGGGQYANATDANSLTNIFNQIIAEILAVNSTFSSPAVSVNAFNRSTHLDDLYFTLFKPNAGEHWDGNLKKFKLSFDSSNDPFISDQFGAPAVDAITGFFKEDITSFWTSGTDVPDGGEAKLGGAASKLTATRNIYTFTGAYTGTLGVADPGANGALTLASNALDKVNTAVTETMLDIVGFAAIFGTTPYRDTMLDWVSGIDVLDQNGNGFDNDARRIMGDPLHAEPALVQYGQTVGGDPDLVAYVATNDGYLHAVNSLTGLEYFSFVPQELLPKLKNIFENDGTTGKAYGLDGNVVPWINDANKDGTISGVSEHVYLYVGMRRGGNNIYSIDVTNRALPSLRWVIQGGVGDYAELGQTWSTPNVEKIRLGGVDRTVLIFAGGYDTAQDTVSVRTADGVGRSIFIVDADTGALLWRAGPDVGADLQLTDMKYSIPARIKPLDIDGDRYIDRLYTGDMGGQLWRFDIEPSETVSTLSTLVSGGRIADLAVDAVAADTRRFYYPPDVALIAESGQSPYLSIVAASGYRSHPLNEDIHDRIYMIREDDIFRAPSPTYTTVTEADLFDTTSNIIGEGTDIERDTAATSLGNAKGWYIALNELDGSYVGEKSLSEPLILSGTAIVTTYIPSQSTSGATVSCVPNDGSGKIFFVNVTDGTPTYDLSGDDSKSREDRHQYLQRGGIPPSPSVIITQDGSPTLCVGTECQNANLVDVIGKSYWYEVE